MAAACAAGFRPVVVLQVLSCGVSGGFKVQDVASSGFGVQGFGFEV